MKLRYLAIPIVIAGVVLAPSCTTIVPQGHVGAVYDKMEKGVQDYTLSEGFHFKTPWQKVNAFPTSIETVYMSADKREGSKENEEVTIGCNDGSLKADLTEALYPFINNLTGRKPIILPIILDIKK